MATAYKLLILIIFCTLSLFVKGQEVVHASFSTFDYQGCVPVKVQFADNSTGSPTSWFWDFGDGYTSTQSNPANIYTIPGTYKVKLVVKNAVSVDSTYNVVVISGLKAEFNYSYNNICKDTATIDFTIPVYIGTIDYHWDFGDSAKDVLPNTSHLYKNPGTYKVSLTTISPEGCTDSTVKVIQIGGGTVSFEAPATICVNDIITFTSNSTPQPKTASWSVNNITVPQSSPDKLIYRFTSPGTYNIQLSANFGTCSNVDNKQIRVLDKPKAAFSLSGNFKSCNYPDTVKFNNASTNAVAFKWYFGDGDSSTDVNPMHVYGAGNYTPVLVAYNANGCADTLSNTDGVFLGGPIINKINLPDSGCVPHPITFNASLTTPDIIAGYSWDFGDGNTDTIEQPTHTYTVAGNYNIQLTVTTTNGCTATRIFSNAVKVGAYSNPNFTADKNTVCGSDTIQFSGTADGPVSYWLWKFNGIYAAFSQNPIHSFTDTGKMPVKLIVNNNGCVDSSKEDYIVVQPSVSYNKHQYFCDDRSKVQFLDRSIGAQSWFWDFADGTKFDGQNPPIHKYTSDGIYYPSLTTKNGTCIDTYVDTIFINTFTKPVFNFNPAGGKICRKADIEMGVDNPTYVLDYLWNLGDGRTLFSDTSIHISYYQAGIYNPSLIIRSYNGCQDTLYSPDPVVVSGPTATFNTALPATCLNDTTLFVDNSFSDGEHPIVDRVWTYGDNTTESNNTGPYTHIYNTSGTYQAMLAVADNNNCADTARFNVIVNALPSVSAGLDSFVCEGSSILLQPSGALSYVWNSDPTLSCLACTNPEAAPKQPTSYIVTGTDASSCKASDTIMVEVIHPEKMRVDGAPRDICFTKNVQLSASGVDLYTWLPADGLNDATSSNPIASPQTTTAYTVIGTDSKKCFSDTGHVVVNVHPNPEVTILNNELVVEKDSKTLISTTGSNNIVKWYWYPSQGLSCTDCPQPVVNAQKNITYTAVTYADFGCTDTATLTVHVLCDQNKIYIPSAFTPNGDGKNDRFYVISSVDNPVRSFLVYNRAGKLIFNKTGNITNYSLEGWDGTYNGNPAPTGTYIYHIEVMCNDTVVPFTGTVTLIR